MNSEAQPNYSPASVESYIQTSDGSRCALTYKELNVKEIIEVVKDDGAGATAVFIGTTRNSFKGKLVTRLEYQAYSKLALKTMEHIIDTTRASISRSEHNTSTTASSLIRCALYHRLGTVPVGEPSVVIAVSSPHRKEAFVACELILEEVKKKAQIWKREYYDGEREDEAEWKENA